MTTTTSRKSGKGKYGDRPSVLVHLLDSKAATKVARRVIAAQYGLTAAEAAKYTVDSDLVVVKTALDKDGKAHDAWVVSDDRDVAVICSEGVGWNCDEVGLVSVPVTWAGSYGSGSTVQISGKVLWSLRSAKTVDLADHVRVFGDRLERNHDLWARAIGDADQHLDTPKGK